MLACLGCEWRLTSADDAEKVVQVERYDRIESLYLTTGDYSALQQMNITYPQQTRTLIEDVLRIGQVNDPEINNKFLQYFQDSTLQELVAAVQLEYADMSDVNTALTDAFKRLKELIPTVEPPLVYAQIGSLDQSIVVGNGMLAISLDKYLGEHYWLYHRSDYGYTAEQRKQMTRQMIVPDCLGFYLMSIYPLPADHETDQLARDIHVGRIQWVVNRVMNKQVFRSAYVRQAANYMRQHKDVNIDMLLSSYN
jgi:hypothetical protein